MNSPREITPEQILDLLKIPYWQRTGRLAFCCPIHDDKDPSAGFYQSTNLAHCFSCGYTVGPILFYAKVTGQPKKDAVRDLEKVFGPLTEKTRKADRHLLNMNRARAESELRSVRYLQRTAHARLGELLDKILLAYERDQIEEERLDTLLKIWYNKVREASNARSDQRRTAESDLDGRIEEGLGDIPRPRPEADGRALEDAGADGAVDLA